jgi:hypothetical protein
MIGSSRWPESAVGSRPPMIMRPSLWRPGCGRLLSVSRPRSCLFPKRAQVFFRELITDFFV